MNYGEVEPMLGANIAVKQSRQDELVQDELVQDELVQDWLLPFWSIHLEEM